jgi:hypothetical protein
MLNDETPVNGLKLLSDRFIEPLLGCPFLHLSRLLEGMTLRTSSVARATDAQDVTAHPQR